MSFMNPNSDFEAVKNAEKLEEMLQQQGLSTAQVMENPQTLFEKFEAGTINSSEMNDLFMLMGDTGNQAMAERMQEAFRTHGGGSTLMAGFADLVNQTLAAKYGSVTFSVNRRVSNVSPLEAADNPLEPTNGQITESYINLEAEGVPPGDLDAAMGAGGALDNMATVQAMAGLAQQYNAVEADPYIAQVVLDNQVEAAERLAAEQAQADLKIQQQLDNPYEQGGPATPAMRT